LSKLHALATGRQHRATFLSNSTFLLCLHILLLNELNALSYGLCKHVYRTVGPTSTVSVIYLTTRSDAKTAVLCKDSK